MFVNPAHLAPAPVGPVAEPVEDASVEEGRVSGGPVLEAVSARVHSGDDMEVLHDLLGEPLVQLLVVVMYEALPLGALLALGNEGGVLVSLEQPRHLAVGPQHVHPLQGSRSPTRLTRQG